MTEVSKRRERLTWPLPTSISCEVESEVQTVRDVLGLSSEEGLQRVRVWAWKQAADAKIQSLCVALALAAGSLVPQHCAWGTANRNKEFVLVEIMVALAVARLRAAYRRGQFPKWLVRTARCMAPGTFEELMIAGSCFEYLLRQMLQGKIYRNGGVVYMLWSSAGVYIGKASMVRATGPGIAQRCAEHVRLLLRPGSRDSSKKRYVQHRRVLNTVNFMPILALDSAARVTAMESTLIATEAPDLNLAEMREDMQKRGRGLKLPVRRLQRLRPPPRFRRPDPRQGPQVFQLLDGSMAWARRVASVWSSPLVSNLATKKEDLALGIHQKFKGTNKLHYNDLYRFMIRERAASTGEYGPLWLFAWDNRQLFATWMAKKLPKFRLPWSWWPWQIAKYLYGVRQEIDILVCQASRKLHFIANIEVLLKRHRLPSGSPRPLLLPPELMRYKKVLAKSILSALDHIRNEPARAWLQKRLKIQPACIKTWKGRANGNAKLRYFNVEDLPKDACEIGKASHVHSLHAVDGAWRLPERPREAEVEKQLRSTWHRWAGQARVHVRVHGVGRDRIHHFLAHWQREERPEEWADLEKPLREATKEKKLLVGDDRCSTRMWLVEASEAFLYILSALLKDTEVWQKSDFSLEQVQKVLQARVIWGLPEFLRRRVKKVDPTPSIFPLVKSKCWGAGGEHQCSSGPLHSCWRRVIDTSRTPCQAGWRVIARAVRMVVTTCKVSAEVFNLDGVRQELEKEVKQLNCQATGACLRCGAGLSVPLSVVVTDIDQAFEACSASRVMPSWSVLLQLFRQQTQDAVLVRKGRKSCTRLGREGFGQSWWLINLEMMSKALLATSLISFGCLGPLVFTCAGLPIGGVMSMVAVAIVLAVEEYKFGVDIEKQKQNGYVCEGFEFRECVARKRYVDDLCLVSRCWCCECLRNLASITYVEKLSPVSDSLQGPITWVDMELRVVQGGLLVLPKNVNRKILLDFGDTGYLDRSGFSSVFIEWPGAMPRGFNMIRSVLLGRISRCKALELGEGILEIYMLETILELYLVRYPLSLIRALIHSLPASSGVVSARRVFRRWSQMGKRQGSNWGSNAQGNGNWRDNPQGRGYGSGHGKYGRDRSYDYYDQKRSHSPREWRRKRSPSTSPDARAGRELERAKKLVRENSPTYKAAIEAKHKETEQKQKDEMLEQGKVLAEALGRRFEDVLKAVVPAGATGSVTPNAGMQSSPASASPMGSSPFPPAPPGVVAVRRDEGVPGPGVSMVLAKDRVRWIQAELGGKIKLGQTKDEFVAGIKACKDRKVTDKLNKLWKDNGGPSVLPRSIEQRAIGLFEAMVKLD